MSRLRVNECTLRKRLEEGTGSSKLGRFSRTFTEEQEKELAEHCRKMDRMFFGLSYRTFRKVVFEYAERNNIPHSFSKESKMAGREWVKAFMKRNRLSFRTPMKTSVARAMAFNQVQVARFFDLLQKVKEKYNFQSSQIFNVDKSGFSTVPNGVEIVINPTEEKIVGKVVSADRGTLITAVCCFSATGTMVPPVFIFPRKRRKPEFLNGAPDGSKLMTFDSGYTSIL